MRFCEFFVSCSVLTDLQGGNISIIAIIIVIILTMIIIIIIIIKNILTILLNSKIKKNDNSLKKFLIIGCSIL